MDDTRPIPGSAEPAIALRRILVLVGVGLSVGVATQVLQGILPGALNWVANSMSGWLVVAFLVGSRMPSARWGAGSGPPVLLAALVGYYATTLVRFGIGGSTATLVFWSVGAVAGGVVFGAAGWWWRNGTPGVRALAAGLLGALLIAEGLYFLTILPDGTVGVGAIVAGLAAPLVLGRTWRDRALGEAALVPGLALGAAGYAVTLGLYSILTG